MINTTIPMPMSLTLASWYSHCAIVLPFIWRMQADWKSTGWLSTLTNPTDLFIGGSISLSLRGGSEAAFCKRRKNCLLSQNWETQQGWLHTIHDAVQTIIKHPQTNIYHLIHDLLFLAISTIESAVGKRLKTHCCVSRLACSRSSGHMEPHSPRLQAWNQHNYDGHELS